MGKIGRERFFLFSPLYAGGRSCRGCARGDRSHPPIHVQHSTYTGTYTHPPTVPLPTTQVSVSVSRLPLSTLFSVSTKRGEGDRSAVFTYAYLDMTPET